MTRARRLWRLLPTVLIGVLLAACAGRQSAEYASGAGQGTYKVGPPYEVNGIWYYPKVDYHYDKTGVASWYGESYQGRPTANGEIYDVNGLTAAHPTLPMPSIVRVTNLENGRSLRLRVNDRGPFARGRIIDVSRRAAQLLGFERQGTASVEVKILKQPSIRVAELAMHHRGGGAVELAEADPAAVAASAPATAPATGPPASPSAVASRPATPPAARFDRRPAGDVIARTAAPEPTSQRLPPPARDFASLETALTGQPTPPEARATDAQSPPPSPRMELVAFKPWYFIQVGAFSLRRNAERAESHLAGLGRVEAIAATAEGAGFYRVRVGPLSTLEQAKKVLSRVVGRGYRDARIVFD